MSQLNLNKKNNLKINTMHDNSFDVLLITLQVLLQIVTNVFGEYPIPLIFKMRPPAVLPLKT